MKRNKLTERVLPLGPPLLRNSPKGELTQGMLPRLASPLSQSESVDLFGSEDCGEASRTPRAGQRPHVECADKTNESMVSLAQTGGIA